MTDLVKSLFLVLKGERVSSGPQFKGNLTAEVGGSGSHGTHSPEADRTRCSFFYSVCSLGESSHLKEFSCSESCQQGKILQSVKLTVDINHHGRLSRLSQA